MKTYQVTYIYPAQPFQTCQNCGKMISWAACLINTQSKKYIHTGVDCAATLADRYTTNQGFSQSRAIRVLKKKYAKQ